MESLSDILGFTPDDLDINRSGKLSDSQRDRLQRMWKRTRNFVIAGFIVVALTATVFLFLGNENESLVLSFIGISLTVVNAAVMGVGATHYLRMQRDLREGRVAVLTGTIRHTILLNRRNRTYILDFAGERLIVPRATFNAFEEGAAYHLYRSPAMKVLLTAERA